MDSTIACMIAFVADSGKYNMIMDADKVIKSVVCLSSYFSLETFVCANMSSDRYISLLKESVKYRNSDCLPFSHSYVNNLNNFDDKERYEQWKNTWESREVAPWEERYLRWNKFVIEFTIHKCKKEGIKASKMGIDIGRHHFQRGAFHILSQAENN